MYFTVGNNHAGVMDQLNQLDLLHRLGTALGYQYLHTGLRDSPHGFSGAVVGDFLGLGTGETPPGPVLRHGRLADADLAALIVPGEDLSPAGLRAVIERRCRRPGIVGYRLLWDYACSAPLRACPALSRPTFDFRAKYWDRRRTWPVAASCEPARVRLVLHLRKGDVACVPCKARFVYRGQRVASNAGLQYADVAPAFYREIIERLCAAHGPEAISIVVLSNGYAGFLRQVAAARALADDARELIENAGRLEEEIRSLEGFPSVRVLMGESEDVLLRSIHAFATADVVATNAGSFGNGCVRRFHRDPKLLGFLLPRQAAAFHAAVANARRTVAALGRRDDD